MTIVSFRSDGNSDALCGRFASIVSQYIDDPTQAQRSAASIPLENLYRVLQMYNYNAFSDERRSGILSLGLPSNTLASRRSRTESWHLRIAEALKNALVHAYMDTPAQTAISEIQATLRWLATAENKPDHDAIERVKAFLSRLSIELR